MRRPATLLLALLLLVPAAAAAHDFWLRGHVEPGEPVAVRLWMGDHFHKGEEVAYKARKAASFVLVDRSGTTDLKPDATDGATPLRTFTPRGEGGHLVAMDRTTSKITLPGWKFTSYLSAEKFESALQARSEAGSTWSEGREIYTRHLKTLVQVGAAQDEVYGTVLGHDYEIVPLNDPSFLAPGDPLVVRVQFEGSPLQDARVVACSMGKEEVETRTDERGGARLVIPTAGVWNVRSVHIAPCDGCNHAEWQSWWASYQFSNNR